MKLIDTHFSMNRTIQPARFFLLPLLLLTLISFFGTVSFVSAQTTAEVCRETEKVWEQYYKEYNAESLNYDFKRRELDMKQHLTTIAKGSLLKKPELELLASILGLKLPKEFGRMTVDERFAFQRKLQQRLKQRLQEISDVTLDEIHERIERISQQLKTRRERSNALDCQGVLAREKGNGECQREGIWTQYDTPGISSTVWEIKSDGKATETRGGNAEGKASLNGKVLRIDWTTNTGYAGYYQWTLNENCTSGEGELKFTKPRTDKLKSSVRKN